MSRASRGVSFKTARAPAAAHATTAHHAAANAAAPALASKPPAAAAEHSVAGSAASAALAQGDRALAQASNANRRFGPEVPEDAVQAAPGVAPESAQATAAAAAAKLEMRETRETRETREAAASGARHLGPESAGPVNALKPLGEVNAENAEREAAFINARKEQRQDGAKHRQDGAPRRLEDQLPKLPFVPGCKSDNAARCGLDAGVLKGSLADVARRMVAKT